MALVRIRNPSMMNIDTPTDSAPPVTAKRKRASPVSSMDEYKDEMKFYYLGLNYTLGKVRETMELHYNIGASLIQYRERLNKWGFKKRGTKRQWEAIAEFVLTRGDQKESEAVINGDFWVSSKKVKKEIARKFTLSELARMKNKVSAMEVASPFSLTSGTVEVRSPIASPVNWTIFDSWSIPVELINSLPIRISDPEIIKICKSALACTWGLQIEEKFIIKSRRFKDLRLLLYQLSNRLLDFEIINGILDRLKAEDGYQTLIQLISLNTISVRAACSSLLLFFVVRLESNLIQLIHQHHPDITAAWIHKLNQSAHLSVLKDTEEELNIYEAHFLHDLRRTGSFTTWNANALRFLRSCFPNQQQRKIPRDSIPDRLYVRNFTPRIQAGSEVVSHKMPGSLEIVSHRKSTCISESWSQNALPETSPFGTRVSTFETKRDYTLTRPLHFNHSSSIDISLLILRALLFEQIHDARLLLRSIAHATSSKSEGARGFDPAIPGLSQEWFWAEVSPFLDVYLTPKHLCSFLCAVILVKQPELLRLLLEYIQKNRKASTEKKYIEEYIEDIPTRTIHEVSNGFIKIYATAARTNLETLVVPIEDCLTIFWPPEPCSLDIEAGSGTSPHFGANKELDLDREVLVIKDGSLYLIPLLSPWEEDSSIIDSLFWLERGSYDDHDQLIWVQDTQDNFGVITVRLLMDMLINEREPPPESRRMDGLRTPWDYAGFRSIYDANIRMKPCLQEVFKSFDWITVLRKGSEKQSTKSNNQNKYKNTNTNITNFRKALPHCDREIMMRSDQGLRMATEYVFDCLEYYASHNLELSDSVFEWVKFLFRESKANVDDRSTEEGLIINKRQGRTLLQVAADWFNNIRLLQTLINEGADVNTQGTLGTALQSCCQRPTTIKTPGVTRINTVRFLVEAGANVNPRDADNKRPQFTPLDGAVLTGDLAVARYLLEKGACIDLETVKYAVSYGRLDMVSLFVQFDLSFHTSALEFARLYGESVIEEYLDGKNLGLGLSGAPSEFVIFNRIDELGD
ncbi:hypothetical protein TWF506_007646 [Arthrobotrys conoides]|uniref:Clr5 domain-containing protein n=1 Tax=Arthrobotrys conoides TaxID=74498 RepID=A0AAN8N7K5_9PEZI